MDMCVNKLTRTATVVQSCQDRKTYIKNPQQPISVLAQKIDNWLCFIVAYATTLPGSEACLTTYGRTDVTNFNQGSYYIYGSGITLPVIVTSTDLRWIQVP